MSTVELNGTTVYVSAIESVEDGVSGEYERLFRKASNDVFFLGWSAGSSEPLEELHKKIDAVEFPDVKDHPAVIVKLTSGREFRIVGKTRKEVEHDIIWAKRRGHNG